MIIRLLIRLLLIGLLAYLVYTLWRSLLAAFTRSDGGQPPVTRPEVGEPMVLDPQCGTHIPRSDALTGSVKGRTYHFCSRECRDAFCARG
jgi:YHS domain-containing protein